MDSFWATIGKLGYFFIITCGHAGRHCLVLCVALDVCGDCWVIVVATARGDGTGKVKLKAVKITNINRHTLYIFSLDCFNINIRFDGTTGKFNNLGTAFRLPTFCPDLDHVPGRSGLQQGHRSLQRQLNVSMRHRREVHPQQVQMRRREALRRQLGRGRLLERKV